MGVTSIEWTDVTWNPVRGCSRVSPGCENCYAERMAARFSGPGQPYEALARMHVRRSSVDDATEPRWTGRVRLVPERLADPLRWRKPRRVFVNSMSDLFHEGLKDTEIAAVFGVMLLCGHHTFQVLTKRAERMRNFMATWTMEGCLEALVHTDHVGLLKPEFSKHVSSEMRKRGWEPQADHWPAPWIWLGVSVEDQERADERIPLLLETPAAVRFLSVEPLLGPVDLTRIGAHRGEPLSALEEIVGHVERPRIDWVIVGGESGPGARPCDAHWIRSVVHQCKAAGVPVFVKQVGANVRDRNDVGFEAECEVFADGADAGQPTEQNAWPTPVDIEEDPDRDGTHGYQGAEVRVHLHDRKGADPEEWPWSLRVQEFPAKET